MMRLYSLFGLIGFWLLWPFWFVYFKVASTRTRVLLMHKNEVLFIKGWLRAENTWSLPGGGVHKNETRTAGAIREVKEEVGIEISASELRAIGESLHTQFGLRYKAYFYVVDLKEKTVPKPRKSEVLEAMWIDMSQIQDSMLDEDARFALQRYIS